MKPVLCIAIAFFSVTQPVFSQKTDTLLIRKQVYSLTPESAGKALREVIAEDQKYRGSATNDSLDLAHLVWLSYFVDRFGYPDRKIYGNDSFSASVIWIHNHRRLRIASFPIIFKGFMTGQVRENDLRDYYLRTIYTYRFDDEEYLHLSLNDLFKILELNTHSSVSISQLMKVADEVAAFKKQPRKRLGVWRAEAGSKTYDKDGKKVTVEFEGEKAEIFQTPDDKTYLNLFSSYGAKEPQELYLSDDGSYRYKNLKTDTYFVLEAGELRLMRGDKVEKEYKKG